MLLGCTEGEVRLANGTNLQGLVEICLNNEWGTVCNQMWDNRDAAVVCRQLGKPSVGKLAATIYILSNGLTILPNIL